MDTLAGGGCDQPGAHLGLVFQLVEMLDQFEAYGLKYVGRVRRGKSEADGDRVNQAAIPRDKHFPGFCISFKTH